MQTTISRTRPKYYDDRSPIRTPAEIDGCGLIAVNRRSREERFVQLQDVPV